MCRLSQDHQNLGTKNPDDTPEPRHDFLLTSECIIGEATAQDGSVGAWAASSSGARRRACWFGAGGGGFGVTPLPSTRPDDATREIVLRCSSYGLRSARRRDLEHTSFPPSCRGLGRHRHSFIFTIEGPHGLLKMSAPDDAARDAWKKALADAIADVARTTRGYLLVKVM